MPTKRDQFTPDFQEAYDNLTEDAYRALEKFCKATKIDISSDDTAELVLFFLADMLRRIGVESAGK